MLANPLKSLARLVGFEPTTYGLEVGILQEIKNKARRKKLSKINRNSKIGIKNGEPLIDIENDQG